MRLKPQNFSLKSLISLVLMIPVSLVFGISSGGASTEHHGHSLVGELAYPKGFKHFRHVNPEAPKGGEVRLGSLSPFDSFNFLIPQGTPPAGLGFIYDTLMEPSPDEISSQYGLLASSLSFPDDFSFATFTLRPEARWHDGQPITSDDVIFSFETITRLHPLYKAYYSHVMNVEKLGTHKVKFVFDVKGNRELPHILGQLIVMPKHYWEGLDSEGQPRDPGKITLVPPLGSGPYRIGTFQPGRSVTYERVEDYWGKSLNVNIGRNNFDKITYQFFLEGDAEFDAFKLGKIDWRSENTARRWANDYDFSAVRDGRVIKETFENKNSGIMQGFLFNLRRDKFSDIRVRKALGRVFNFEAANRSFFYDQYERINSYFFPTEFAASGLPEGAERAYLEAVREDVPESVFTEVFTNPVFKDKRDERKARREALALLKAAGWTIKDGQLTNAAGEVFTIEFLLSSSTFEKITLFYKEALEALGIDVHIRLTEKSQFRERLNNRDYDVIIDGWGQSLSPGNEQKEYWGSESADVTGSKNYIGIKDKAIDYLIDKVILAPDRQALIDATRALDRVLLHHYFLVPQWSIRYSRTARWDRFGRPERLPEYSPAFPSIWWEDSAKAD